MNSRPLADLVLALRREGLVTTPPAASPIALTGVSADSRSIAPGAAYIAVRGSQADGHQFVADAVKRGAAALVVEQAMGSGIPEVVVTEGRRAAMVAGRFWYDDPARSLTLVGITGTNGKTTTTALVRHLLNGEGRAGSIGTLGAFDGQGDSVDSTAGSLTTPGPVDLQATLAALVAAGSDPCRDGDLVAQPRPGAARRADFRRGHFHQPDPRPSGLSRHHGVLSRREAAADRTASGSTAAEIVNADDPAWNAIPARAHRFSFGFNAERRGLRPPTSGWITAAAGSGW